MAAKVKNSCVRCRFLEKKNVGQKMSVLPPELLVPCPPFTNLGIDLAGPFLLKIDGAERRTRANRGSKKCWVVVIVCLNTKAVKLYISWDILQRIFYMRGASTHLTTDTLKWFIQIEVHS